MKRPAPDQHEGVGLRAFQDLARQRADPRSNFLLDNRQSFDSADRGGKLPPIPVHLPSELDVQAGNTAAAQAATGGRTSDHGTEAPIQMTTPLIDIYRTYRRPVVVDGPFQPGNP